MFNSLFRNGKGALKANGSGMYIANFKTKGLGLGTYTAMVYNSDALVDQISFVVLTKGKSQGIGILKK